MRCPFCGQDEDKVIESRTTDEGKAIRRRRECVKCGGRFTSYERVEESPLMVIKKDGRREPYKREKVMQGLVKACEKRPVSMEALESLLDDVEKVLHHDEGREVSTVNIGKLIMERLPKIDKVAYVRFASVYREFEDVKEFVKEIKEIS